MKPTHFQSVSFFVIFVFVPPPQEHIKPSKNTFINMMSNNDDNNIHSPSNNPVLKIPLIHKIFSFAASDVIRCEELSRVTFSWREALEIYGKAVFADFAMRESREYFRFFFELCEWAEDSWMIEMMIDAWNENFSGAENFVRDQTKREYESTDKARQGHTAPKPSHGYDPASSASKDLKARIEKINDKLLNDAKPLNFFNCPAMTRCVQENARYPSHIAARYDRYEILKALYQKGCPIDQPDAHGKGVAESAVHHEAYRSLFVILEQHRENYLISNNKDDDEERKRLHEELIKKGDELFAAQPTEDELYSICEHESTVDSEKTIALRKDFKQRTDAYRAHAEMEYTAMMHSRDFPLILYRAANHRRYLEDRDDNNNNNNNNKTEEQKKPKQKQTREEEEQERGLTYEWDRIREILFSEKSKKELRNELDGCSPMEEGVGERGGCWWTDALKKYSVLFAESDIKALGFHFEDEPIDDDDNGNNSGPGAIAWNNAAAAAAAADWGDDAVDDWK